MEPLTVGLLAGGILAGLSAASVAALKGWQGWLELKRFELTHASCDRTLPPASGRIELADLPELVEIEDGQPFILQLDQALLP